MEWWTEMPKPETDTADARRLKAIAVSRDVARFEGLPECMERQAGPGWAELDAAATHPALRGADAKSLKFLVVAADADDERDMDPIVDVVRHATSIGVRVILVGAGLKPQTEELLRSNGLDAALSCPLVPATFRTTVDRAIAAPKNRPGSQTAVGEAAEGVDGSGAARRSRDRPTGKREASLYAVQSAAGGDGATTLAVNLAWELANSSVDPDQSVCLIDLGLQFGSVATYLDLPRRPVILEMLSDVSSMDEQAFRQALVTYRDRLSVFTAPPDILPLDMIGPDDVGALLRLARTCFDVVVVDMPTAVTGWTDAVFKLCDLYFVTCGLEVRSAQNALRFSRLLQAEGMPMDTMAFVLNRGPGRMDLGGRSRVDRMATSLNVAFHAVLSDGGKPVTEANDRGGALGFEAPRNPLARDVRTLADGLAKARAARKTDTTTVGRRAGGRSFLGVRFG